MIAPAPTVCPACIGSGVADYLFADNDFITAASVPPFPAPPCLVCKCWCGQPAVSIGGMCTEHEDAADIEDDTRHRRAAR